MHDLSSTPWPPDWDEAPLPDLNDYGSKPRAEITEPSEVLEVVKACELAGKSVPIRQFIVADMIPARTVTLFSGDGGVGKSLVALDLAVAVASGGAWLDTLPEPGPVVFLTAEDELDEVHRRLDAIVQARAISYDGLGALTIVPRAGRDALLALADDKHVLRATQLLHGVERLICDGGAKLLVLDTAADLHAGNENDRAQVRQFISILRGLALTYDVAVLLLSLPSQTGMQNGLGYSGSTAWNNSVRSRLYIERSKGFEGGEPDPDLRVLRLMKANYSRVGSEKYLRWRDGVFVAERGPAGLDRLAAEAKAKDVMLRLLARCEEQGVSVSANPSSTYAPIVLSRRPDAEGVSKIAFARAMVDLLNEGKIVTEVLGPPSKPRTRLSVVSNLRFCEA